MSSRSPRSLFSSSSTEFAGLQYLPNQVGAESTHDLPTRSTAVGCQNRDRAPSASVMLWRALTVLTTAIHPRRPPWNTGKTFGLGSGSPVRSPRRPRASSRRSLCELRSWNLVPSGIPWPIARGLALVGAVSGAHSSTYCLGCAGHGLHKRPPAVSSDGRPVAHSQRSTSSRNPA